MARGSLISELGYTTHLFDASLAATHLRALYTKHRHALRQSKQHPVTHWMCRKWNVRDLISQSDGNSISVIVLQFFVGICAALRNSEACK